MSRASVSPAGQKEPSTVPGMPTHPSPSGRGGKTGIQAYGRGPRPARVNLSTPLHPRRKDKARAQAAPAVMPVDTQRWPVHAEAGRVSGGIFYRPEPIPQSRAGLVGAHGQHACARVCVCFYKHARVQGSDLQGAGWVRDMCVYVGALAVGAGYLGTSTGTTVDGAGVGCAAFLPSLCGAGCVQQSVEELEGMPRLCGGRLFLVL